MTICYPPKETTTISPLKTWPTQASRTTSAAKLNCQEKNSSTPRKSQRFLLFPRPVQPLNWWSWHKMTVICSINWNGMVSSFECFLWSGVQVVAKDVFPQHDEWQTFILRDFDLKKHLLTLHISIWMTHAKKCLRKKSTFSDTKKPLI